ncbi:MAG: cytochrome c3 family protein [Anaerolineae bacterium]
MSVLSRDRKVEESSAHAKQITRKPKGLRRLLRWPDVTIDLSQPRHQRAVLIAFTLLIIASSAFAYGNYRIYEYTESSEFCGTACHTMAPEFARYESSPHANVACVECHIGPGASFFVKSKIDGLRQVIAVLTDSYSRPIKSPVHNLRPARETCETCHTPTSFKDNIIKTIIHYDNDAENTRIQSTLILKMGGWQESTGISQGIHWHTTTPVYYIAADEQRQVILWVGVEQPDGTLKEYFARDMLNMAQTDFVEQAFEKGEVREMDCIDCHNRTAHYVPSPQESVDEAISANQISRELPFIRSKAVDVLSASYGSKADAYDAIEQIAEFYGVKDLSEEAVQSSEWLISRNAMLATSLDTIKQIYDETHFPEMGQNWETNPNNARHTPFLGCFRCHDGKHASVDDNGREVETISVKCNLCHTVPIVGRGDELLVESPVIAGATPDSHADFRWTIEHRSVTDADKQECYQCHGQGFCNNGVCHNLSHPPDMLFTHAEEYRVRGDQVCYTCHQNILCSRCHPGGIVRNP